MSTENTAATPETSLVETLENADLATYEHFRKTGELPEAAKEETESAPAAEAEGKTEGTSDTPEKHDQGDDEKAPVPKGIQKRFDKLTREKHELRNRLTLLERQLAEKPTATPAATVEKQSQPTDGEPKLEDFDSYEAHQSALIDHRVQKALKAAAERQAQETEKAKAEESQRAIAEHIEKQVNDGRAKYADWDTVVTDDVELDDQTYGLVAQSDVTGDLLHYFGSNPAEAARFAALPAHRRGPELGKIEARLTPVETAAPEEKPRKSNAPAPIKPVRSGSIPKTPSLSDPDLSFSDFERLRKAGKTA